MENPIARGKNSALKTVFQNSSINKKIGLTHPLPLPFRVNVAARFSNPNHMKSGEFSVKQYPPNRYFIKTIRRVII